MGIILKEAFGRLVTDMPRTFVSIALILSAMAIGTSSSQASVEAVPQWRLHSAKACNLYFHKKFNEALNEYRRALAFADRDNAAHGVKIDLQLNMARILTLIGSPREAQEILDRLPRTAVSDDSLLSMRYWRRRVDVAVAVRDVDEALKCKKHVVEIMSKYFDASSPSYILELYDYETHLLNAKKYAEAVEIDEKILRLKERNITRFARSVCTRCLRFSTQRFEQTVKTICYSPSPPPLLVRKIESILNRSDSPAGEQIFCANFIMRSSDAVARESAAKRVLRVANSNKAFANDASSAALQLMFLRLYSEVYDDVTEKLAKDAFDRFRSPGIADKVGRFQATTMYSMVLAMRGKLEEAERVINTLPFEPDTMTEYRDFHPIYQARYEIAVESARQRKPARVKEQFKVLREQFALQPRIPLKVKTERLTGWQNEENKLVPEASKISK